jgi:hypothetical protein
MPPFRTVHGGRAGPRAVGILVPPGNRTLVVLRPRALELDLVLVRRGPGDGAAGFMEMPRQQAGVDAQKLAQALVSWASGGAGQVEAFAADDGDGYWIRVEVETFPLLACARLPGQPYRPKVFATLEEAERMADELRSVLCPPVDANQELYTNLSQFGR